MIDPSSNLKPWTDEAYNIGTFSGTSGIGLRPATVYAAGSVSSNSGFELGKFANNSYELCNDPTTGSALNGLAVLGSSGCAVKPATAATSGVIGVVIANAGTTGTATLVRTGSAFCSFDATPTVVGDYVVASSTANAGAYALCHDAGASLPNSGQVLGRVLQPTTGGITAQMFFDMPGSSVNAAAAGGNVFGGWSGASEPGVLRELFHECESAGGDYLRQHAGRFHEQSVSGDICREAVPGAGARRGFDDLRDGNAELLGVGGAGDSTGGTRHSRRRRSDRREMPGARGRRLRLDRTSWRRWGAPAQPTLTCNATGGSLANGSYYVEIAWVNNLETYAGAAAIPGYSSASTEKSVTCANGTSTQSISVTSPGAAGGSNAIAATDFAVYSSAGMGQEASGCSQVTQNCVTQNLTCGANGAGVSDATACKLGSTATITAMASTANGGNPVPLVDTSNPMVVIARGSKASSISFGTDLRDISLNGSGTGSDTAAANEPSVGLLNLQGQEQSGLQGVIVNGPFLSAGLYAETDAVNFHITNSQLGGGSSSTTSYIPAIFDNRISGNVKVQGGTPHGIFDTTITCRTSGAVCPEVVLVTGANGNLPLIGDHIETNSGDCVLTTNSASASVVGGANQCPNGTVHNAASGRHISIANVDQNGGSYSARDDAIAAGTGNCYSNNSYCAAVHQSYDSALYAGSLNVLNATVGSSLTLPVTGSTQCLHVNASGVVSGAGADCAAAVAPPDNSGDGVDDGAALEQRRDGVFVEREQSGVVWDDPGIQEDDFAGELLRGNRGYGGSDV